MSIRRFDSNKRVLNTFPLPGNPYTSVQQTNSDQVERQHESVSGDNYWIWQSG